MRLKRYIIEKGSHKANGFNFGLKFTRSVERELYFDSSAWYKKENSDSHDLNKLFGFSTSFNHHKNSVRFAWRPNFKKEGFIEIFGYQYNNGTRQFVKITDVKCGMWYRYNIDINTDVADYTVEALVTGIIKSNSMPYYTMFGYSLGFKLFPYFGGQNVAPRNMFMVFNRRV